MASLEYRQVDTKNFSQISSRSYTDGMEKNLFLRGSVKNNPLPNRADYSANENASERRIDDLKVTNTIVSNINVPSEIAELIAKRIHLMVLNNLVRSIYLRESGQANRENMAKIVIGYVRVSTAMQTWGNFTSIDAQKSVILDYGT